MASTIIIKDVEIFDNRYNNTLMDSPEILVNYFRRMLTYLMLLFSRIVGIWNL